MAAESFTVLAVAKLRDEASAAWDKLRLTVDKFKSSTEDAATEVKIATTSIDDSLHKTAAGSDALDVAAAKITAATRIQTEALKKLGEAEQDLLRINAEIAASSLNDAEMFKKEAEAAEKLAIAEREAAKATKQLTDAQARQDLIQKKLAEQSSMQVRDTNEKISESSKKVKDSEDKQTDSTKKLDNAQKDAKKSGEGMSIWLKALIGAAIPLAPALVGAGAGFAAFAAMAMPEIKGITDGMATISQDQNAINTALTTAQKNTAIKQMKADWAQIPPEQQKIITQTQAMQAKFTDLGKAVQPQVLSIFGSGLKTVTNLLPQVSKLAVIGGNALQGMMSKLATATQSAGALKFFDMLDKVAAQALPLIGQLVGALGGLLAGALESLAPAAGPALQLLTTLIKALTGPLDTILPVIATAFVQLVQAIEPFLPQLSDLITQGLLILIPLIQELVPLVAEFVQSGLGAILGVLKDIMGPFRDFIGGVDAFLRFISPLVPLLGKLVGWLLVAKTVIGGLKIAMAALNLVMDANPVSLIVIAIAGLVAVFVLLWKKSAAFRDFWKGLWKDIKDIVSAIVDWLKGHWREIIAIIGGPIGIVVALVTKYWNQIVDFIKGAVRIIRGVLDWFGQLGTDFHHWWNDAVNAIATGVTNAVNWIKSLPDKIKNMVADAASWLVEAGKNVIRGLMSGIEQMMGALPGVMGQVTDVVAKGAQAALKAHSPSQRMADEVGKTIPTGIAKGIMDNLGAVRSAAAAAGNVAVSVAGGAGGFPVTSGAGRGSGGTYIDLRGSQVMTERDLDVLVNKLGRALATRTLPSGGLRVAM